VCKPCHLRKQAPVDEGSGEIGYRLTLDQDLVADQVVADLEAGHPHVERAAPENGIKQRRAAFGMVDCELMDRIRHGVRPVRVIRLHPNDDDDIVAG
jgi:hypothetical protein